MKKFVITSAAIVFAGLAFLSSSLISTHACGNKEAGAMEKTNPAYANPKWLADDYTAGSNSPHDLRYEVRGRYERSVKREKLTEARFIRDFVEGYPVNWVTNYTSVEILATCNGTPVKAVSSNEKLSAEEINILRTADPATNISVNVSYTYPNSVTGNFENYKINVSMMVVPETEAEYDGGHAALMKYLKETAINKIADSHPKQQGVVTFTVNESGEIVNAKLFATSGNQQTDKLILDAINNMPKWKPAQDAKGMKVKQEFEFRIGDGGC